MLTQVLEQSPLLRGLVDFAFPPLCPGCGEFLDGPEAVCPTCCDIMPWYEQPFYLEAPDRGDADTPLFPLFAAGDYVDPLKQVVIAFKFRAARGIAEQMAGRVAAVFGQDIRRLGPIILVPIPLHPSREYARGYNQAAVFARALARELDIGVDTDLIVRMKKRRPQARLLQSERATNIRGVFALSEGRTCEGTPGIVLVDDVVTSGQTIFEARRTLMQSGFRVVGAVSIAHGQ